MIVFYLATAAALVMTGIATGIFTVICLGIHHSERHGGLTRDTDSRMDRGVRQLTGAHSRGYEQRWASGGDSYDQAA
jgi:hypothetical protein